MRTETCMAILLAAGTQRQEGWSAAMAPAPELCRGPMGGIAALAGGASLPSAALPVGENGPGRQPGRHGALPRQEGGPRARAPNRRRKQCLAVQSHAQRW